jgi:hypothetical protein
VATRFPHETVRAGKIRPDIVLPKLACPSKLDRSQVAADWDKALISQRGPAVFLMGIPEIARHLNY